MALTYLQIGSWNIIRLGQHSTDDERFLSDHYMVKTKFKIFLDEPDL